MTTTAPPPPDRLFLRLLVEVPTFGNAAIERFAPGEHGAVVELQSDEDQWVVDPFESGVRLATGSLITLVQGKLETVALSFVPSPDQPWVCIGPIVMVSTDHNELPDSLRSDDGGPWQLELWVWPRADRYTTLADRMAIALATPRMGYFPEWLSSAEGQSLLGAIVTEASAEELVGFLVAANDIRPLLAILPPHRLAEWLAERDAATEARVVEGTSVITHPYRDESYGAELRRHLPSRG